MSCVPTRKLVLSDEGPFDELTFQVKVGEPVFILRAQDLASPYAVFQWAVEAARRGASNEKVNGGIAGAREMIAWQGSKKVPD